MISKIVPGWFQRHLILFFNFCVWIQLMFKPNPWWWTLHVGMPQQRQAASSVALIITYFLLSPDVDAWKPFTLSQLSWKTRQLRVPTGRASVPPLAIEVGTTVPTAKWHPQSVIQVLLIYKGLGSNPNLEQECILKEKRTECVCLWDQTGMPTTILIPHWWVNRFSRSLWILLLFWNRVSLQSPGWPATLVLLLQRPEPWDHK